MEQHFTCKSMYSMCHGTRAVLFSHEPCQTSYAVPTHFWLASIRIEYSHSVVNISLWWQRKDNLHGGNACQQNISSMLRVTLVRYRSSSDYTPLHLHSPHHHQRQNSGRKYIWLAQQSREALSGACCPPAVISAKISQLAISF